jgi:hypothetical protein
MKRVAVALVLLLAAACGEDEIEGKQKLPKTPGVPGNIYEVEVDGRPCIIWMDKHGAGDSSWSYSGIDCDWGPR